LKEEAADQSPGKPDPKAKAAPKAVPKKGDAPVEEEVKLAELEATIGQPFPEVTLRLVSSENTTVAGESGRRWKVTMYRERKEPKADDPSEVEILRREVRFGDQRKTYRDPLDPEEPAAPAAKAAAAKGKAPSPPPPAPEDDEEPVEIYIGEASMDGEVGETALLIGGNDAWRLPVHLQPMIYWLRVEDTTEDVSPESFCQVLPALEFPIRVKEGEA